MNGKQQDKNESNEKTHYIPKQYIGQELLYALRLLAEDDEDGATEENKRGFNKTDSHYGQYMSRMRWEAWSDVDKREVYWMVKKYWRQLERKGVMWEKLPKPPREKVESREVGGVEDIDF